MADDDSLKPTKGQPRVSRLWFSFVSSSLLETYNIPVVASSTATSGEWGCHLGWGDGRNPLSNLLPHAFPCTRGPGLSSTWRKAGQPRWGHLPLVSLGETSGTRGDGSLSSRRRRGSRPGRAQGEHTAPAQPGQAEARAAASEPLLTRARQRPNSPLGQATRQHHDPRQLLGSPYLPL